MIPSVPWAVARDDLSRNRTPADEYARREFDGPNANWLLSISDGHGRMTEAESEAPSNDSLFRRLAQVIAAFF